MDYALPLYSATTKSSIQKIKSSYNSAIRLSLGALRSTPVENMLAESGLPSLECRIQSSTGNLASKLINSEGVDLYRYTNNVLKRKHVPRVISTIYRVIQTAKTNKLNIKPVEKPSMKHPPWTFNEESIILDLQNFNKKGTSPSIYLQLFYAIKEKHSDWKFMYTDGSRLASVSAYSIVDERGCLVKTEVLPHYGSIFSAEALAILNAVKICIKQKGRYIICSDSLSTLNAILNTNHKDTAISQIRDLLIAKQLHIKLMWVPSHIGIKGNEKADENAKIATSSPLLMTDCTNKNDIKKLTKSSIQEMVTEKWNSYSHTYKMLNPGRNKAVYPLASRKLTIAYTRFRLGHTLHTHEHIYKKQPRPACIFCNQGERTTQHIIFECQGVKNIGIQHNLPPLKNLLTTITAENIALFHRYLKLLKIEKNV
jgi:hypothetical protein